ncbi:helix-turn-helix transcriptional regulator, partial [Saccharopolyspora gregorii]|uniref:helix-turn-helix transcriptional regulator n=1 Tax=Saccharopolyspora gregorii TaxID=33914 RepID=UPI0031ED070B
MVAVHVRPLGASRARPAEPRTAGPWMRVAGRARLAPWANETWARSCAAAAACARAPAAGVVAGPRRRTPGLRREEVAALAGVSANYYERLEQARGPYPSPQVLDALAAALGLSAAERDHLGRLAEHAPASPEPAAEVPAEVRRLLDRLGPSPPTCSTRGTTCSPGTRPRPALLVDFAALPPRSATSSGCRWRAVRCGASVRGRVHPARRLRAAAGRRPVPGDRRLAELVREFAAHDPEFAAHWREQELGTAAAVPKRIRHPRLGLLDLELQELRVPGHDHRVVLLTAEPGSASAAKLESLASGPRLRAVRVAAAEPASRSEQRPGIDDAPCADRRALHPCPRNGHGPRAGRGWSGVPCARRPPPRAHPLRPLSTMAGTATRPRTRRSADRRARLTAPRTRVRARTTLPRPRRPDGHPGTAATPSRRHPLAPSWVIMEAVRGPGAGERGGAMAEIDTGTTGSAGLDGPAPAPRRTWWPGAHRGVLPAVIVLLLPVAVAWRATH